MNIEEKNSEPTQRRILLVDDNPDDRELVRRLLEKNRSVDYQVHEEENGEGGLSALAKASYDCLLLDYSLPGSNGILVLERIRSEYVDTPVIMLTGYGSEHVAAQALQLGAQDYISKSLISEEIIHQIISNACKRQALLRLSGKQQAALTVFTRALAHDLKEPLRTISSYVDLAKREGGLHKEAMNYLEIAESAVDHMERLVDMVRVYTSLNEQEVEASRLPREASAIVSTALKNLTQQRSEVPNEIEVGDLPCIQVDGTQVVSLFQNLISNALNYGNKDVTKIWISGTHDGEACRFMVKDNGPGVDPTHFEKIFEPFKRLSPGQRRGSGLGLSICRKIVESHGGKIWLESEPGESLSVHFTLPPANTAEPPVPAKPQAEANEPDTKRIANVLHVEDNDSDLLLTRIMLQKQGHVDLNIVTAANGFEALKYLKDSANPPTDLILLDINMPVMDGFEFLERVRAEEGLAKIPIIVCSTSSDERDKRTAKELGAKAYLTKPISLDNFEPSIQSIESVKLHRNNGNYRLEAHG